MSRGEMVRKSRRWQREAMVAGTLCTSVVARTKSTCGGGVDLDQVEAAVGQHGLAGRTAVARLPVLQVQAVDGARHDACGAGLAGAARAREEVGMAESAGPHGVAQRLRDVRLAHHLEEATRTPFAVERWPCCRRWMLHTTPSAVSSQPSGLSVTARTSSSPASHVSSDCPDWREHTGKGGAL